MGWLLKHRKKDNKYRIWTTMSDGWITGWCTEDEIKAEIAFHWRLDHMRKVIEEYMNFPTGWTDKDTYKRVPSDPNKHQAFFDWWDHALHCGDYEGEIERKYNELTKGTQ
jgi:hypothetical protein